jgi:acetyltransferase-like isoleucine patch superfamily enzyme
MSNIYVDSTAIVEKGVNLGKGSQIWHFVHLMENAKIGKNCVIADYVYIGRNVVVGDNVKIENRVSIYNGVKIEDDVFIGPHVTFTNDLFPRSFRNDWEILPTVVKKGCSIGAGAVVVCGCTIGEYVLIGAGSVVTKKIPAHSLVYGNPARIRGFVCRCGRKLDLIKKGEKDVTMKCNFCKEKYNILKQNYFELQKEE